MKKINTDFRSDADEIMDDFQLEGIELQEALDKIAEINQLLGGNKLTLHGVSLLLKKVDKNWVFNNIGKPLKNVNFLINEGQLYISGNNLCVGYTNEKLNKENFCIINGIRFYKTGDLVTQKDEDFFYNGRIDRQFKHNGVLISPEEIESLAMKAGCLEAKCDIKNKFTLFYKGNISIKEVSDYLRLNLNPNMMPKSIIKLESFNTNINGKKVV